MNKRQFQYFLGGTQC
uniref:Uncharacterized protein n=1 Tax=Anguilla anguilla TaxID=7936 RepID=A0A0E9PZN5_ANGAN